MKRYVLGDIHGAYKGLKQVLERANFDYEKDQLIFLGDVCDGWPEIKESIDELLKIKNLVYLLGNHDKWTIEFYTNKMSKDDFELWFSQGGESTLECFGPDIEDKYLNFLQNAKLYHYENDIMFSHAGFDFTEENLSEQNEYFLIWDRQLIKYSQSQPKVFDTYPYTSKFYHSLKEIYVGHTPTISFDKNYLLPQKFNKVWAIDTGAAFFGKLSLMNIDTKEIFQSDFIKQLYPNHKGRNRKSYNEEI